MDIPWHLKFRVESLYCYVWFISFFVVWSKWPKTKKSAVLFVYFLYKKSTFYLKMTADFFIFGHFDQKTKNRKWNEPDKHNRKHPQFEPIVQPQQGTFSFIITHLKASNWLKSEQGHLVGSIRYKDVDFIKAPMCSMVFIRQSNIIWNHTGRVGTDLILFILQLNCALELSLQHCMKLI